MVLSAYKFIALVSAHAVGIVNMTNDENETIEPGTGKDQSHQTIRVTSGNTSFTSKAANLLCHAQLRNTE